MPRSPTVLTPPPGTLPFTPNTTIESGKANAVWLDLYQDGNTPRPIEYGGTGASNAADALNNLGAIGQGNFLASFSIGDGYYSARNIASESGVWLKRDGALYDSTSYPELAALLPALPDGVEWSAVPTALTGTIWAFYADADGFYIGTRSGDDSNIYFSEDMVGFSLRAVIPSFSIEGIMKGGGVFGATDGNGKVTSSNDGVNWTPPFSVNSQGFGPGGLAWSGIVFCAVGGNGSIYTSPDFVTWTSRSSGSSSFLFSVKFLNGNFVVTGGSGVVLTSNSAGETWALRATGVTANLNSSAYLSPNYVIVGSVSSGSAVILSSSDLSTWSVRPSGSAFQLRSVTASSSGFLAVGDNGVARISAQGTAWSSSSTGVSVNLLVAIHDPDTPSVYYTSATTSILKGIRTLTTQFRVPNDAPQYGWIKAEND